MSAADTCPGCGREFVPRGFLNHLQLSHDPRCASVRDRLQPTYLGTHEQDPPHPSSVVDIEMADLSDAEFTAPFNRSNQLNTTIVDMDAAMSYLGGDGIHPQSVFVEAPDVVTCPSDPQALVIFDSDSEDSDVDHDPDQTGAETPPGSPRSGVMDAGSVQTSQTGKFLYTTLFLVFTETN